MKSLHGFLAILAVAMVAIFARSVSANVLSNPGFELGAGADATDWGELGGPAGTTSRSSISPHSGSYHAYMEFDYINNTPSAAPYFIEQNLGVGTIDNTLNYNLSFYAKTDTTDFTGVDMFYQILWLDQDASHGGGVKGETLTQLTPLGINTTYQQFGLSDVDVPDGADSYLLRFQLSPGPIPDIAQGLYVDDAVLAVVPEPATAVLFVLGGLGLVGCMSRRRH